MLDDSYSSMAQHKLDEMIAKAMDRTSSNDFGKLPSDIKRMVNQVIEKETSSQLEKSPSIVFYK